MSIEQAIHDRWRAYRPLAALVPATGDGATNRLFTGAAGGGAGLPYVTLVREGETRIRRTSSRSAIGQTRLVVNVWAATLESAKQIVARVLERFSRAAFDHPGGRVLDMRWTDVRETRQDDGTWLAAVEFYVQTLQAEEG